MLVFLIYGIGAGLVFWLLVKNLAPPPVPMSKEELEQEGLTPAEIRKELRSQRAELREHSMAQARATRTANQIGRSLAKYSRKM